jgi:hypothetical protein
MLLDKKVERLGQTMLDIIEDISKSILIVVFRAWKKRLQQCINDDRNHFESMISSDAIYCRLYSREVGDSGDLPDILQDFLN